MIHGGTTFVEGWSRDQVRNGSRVMEDLMPLVLQIMEDDVNEGSDSNVRGRFNCPRTGDEKPSV